MHPPTLANLVRTLSKYSEMDRRENCPTCGSSKQYPGAIAEEILLRLFSAHLKVRSCVIDGEVVCCDERGLAVFHVLRQRQNEATAFLYAFDLLELDGTDMRREPIEVRKATLASILRKRRPGVRFNEYLEHLDGELVFAHACKMGLEGIVSKRLGSPYRSGRSPDWLKFKNPEAPAVKREAEEDWGR